MQVLLNELKAARIFTSSDDSRYAICGVRIECVKGKKPLLISTDGRRLLIIQSRTDNCEKDEARTLSNTAIDTVVKMAESSKSLLGQKIDITLNPENREAIFEQVACWKLRL